MTNSFNSTSAGARQTSRQRLLAEAYRIAESRVAGNPRLMAYLRSMRRTNSYEAIAADLGITLTEVKHLERELLDSLGAYGLPLTVKQLSI